jgi:hypothetical protein
MRYSRLCFLLEEEVDQGADGLNHSSVKEKLTKVKELRKENHKLKEILAREKQESTLKNDLL